MPDGAADLCQTAQPPAGHQQTGRLTVQGWLRWAVTGFLLVAGMVYSMRIAGCRWNVSASLPLGLYRDVERPLLVGEIVAVCLPPAVATFGYERGYLGRGECEDGMQPVLKRIAAVEGDTVDVQRDAVTITLHGLSTAKSRRLANSAVWDRDSQGRALPHVPWGPYTLRHGELWLMSTSRSNSWDSRYFGPVLVTDVIATTCPAVTATAEGLMP